MACEMEVEEAQGHRDTVVPAPRTIPLKNDLLRPTLSAAYASLQEKSPKQAVRLGLLPWAYVTYVM
jgi:hypothetical protein